MSAEVAASARTFHLLLVNTPIQENPPQLQQALTRATFGQVSLN